MGVLDSQTSTFTALRMGMTRFTDKHGGTIPGTWDLSDELLYKYREYREYREIEPVEGMGRAGEFLQLGVGVRSFRRKNWQNKMSLVVS